MCAPTKLFDNLLVVRDRDVVDVGSGDGWLVRRLAGRGARAVGVEPGPQALARARARAGDGERHLEGRAESLPLPDGSADIVVFFNSLHHVAPERMHDALAEAARILRDGGELFVQEPLPEGPYFELMSPLEDEIEVRRAARAALARAAELGLRPALERTFTPSVELASFEDFHDRHVLVDSHRECRLRAREAQLRDAFARLGTRRGEGWAFDAPAVVSIHRRVDSAVGSA